MEAPNLNSKISQHQITGLATDGFTSSLLFCLMLIYLFFISQVSFAAHHPKSSGRTEWSVSGGVGVSFLDFEITENFEILKNEFRHKPAMLLELGASALMGKRWEPGIRFSLMSLYGESASPDFSAVGNHVSMNELYELPVEYSTKGGELSGLLRFYLRKSSGKRSEKPMINPFVEAGGGLTFFSNELRYKSIPFEEESPVIFEKGKGNQSVFSVSHLAVGAGVKIGKPGERNFYVLYSGKAVNYDFMDAVHNYTNGERNHAKGIISKFSAGIIIPLFNGRKEESGHLPWSPVRSKF